MLPGWSDKKQTNPHYIHEPPKPAIRKASKFTCVKFIVDPDTKNVVLSPMTADPFEDIVSANNPREQAVVTGLYLKYLQNDFNEDNIEIVIEDLFKPNDVIEKAAEEGIENGRYKIKCPPRHNDIINERKETIYKPTLQLPILEKYVGLEDAMMKCNLVELDLCAESESDVENNNNDNNDNNKIHHHHHQRLSKPSQLYKSDHQLVHFIVEHMKDFEFDKHAISKVAGSGTGNGNDVFVRISEDALNVARKYFQTQIFPRIHYTRFEDTKLTCNLENKDYSAQLQKSIVLVLQINYIIVTK